MTKQTFYITTPIYYVNDVPHLGHAYTTVVADAFARFHRQRGDDVRFLTGTDEHGQKIERVAEEQGIKPQELADRVVERFRELWQRLGISHDDFIRTTEQRHKTFVQTLWQRLQDNGDIYLGAYEGWYCVGCEGYYTEKEIDAGRCPVGHNNVEHRREPSYFFALKKYQQKLLDLYDRQGEFAARPVKFVLPDTRLNEVRSFVAGGLEDLSISRTAIRWGIAVPGQPEHTVYVWLDALANYISALGGLTGEGFRYWPASFHLIGKDILRFHGVYWPAFLLSAGLPLPERVVAHGFWTVEGQKMSKSLRNVVDPHFLIEAYGRDVVRYFLLREVPLGQDGDFSHRNLLARINADLANDLGNLVSRTLGMPKRYRDGVVPDVAASSGLGDATTATTRAIEHAMLERLQPHLALEAIWSFVNDVNQYVDRQAPWELAKRGETATLDALLRELLFAVEQVANWLSPFMPDTADRIRQALSGRQLTTIAPMFPRLDAATVEAKLAEVQNLATAKPGNIKPDEHAKEKTAMVSIDQFFETQLVVGEVVAAEAVPKSNKLLKLGVNLGETELRTIVSGIAQSYAPEALVGRRVVVVGNLKPAKLMGIESQGMVLAGEGQDGKVHVLSPAPDVPIGTRIK